MAGVERRGRPKKIEAKLASISGKRQPQVREVVAVKAGFTGGQEMRRVQRVMKHGAPELIEQ